MQVQARSMEMLAVDHLFENAHLLSQSCKKRIRKLITHELLRRENQDLPPLAKTHRATYYNANLSLHDAAEKGDLDRLKYIYEQKGVPLDVKRFGKTALHVALKANQTGVALFLIEQGANVHLADDEGFTPLHYAAISKNLRAIKELLRKRVNVSAVDNVGKTALYHITETHGGEHIIKLLVKYHSLITAMAKIGSDTLDHIAATQGMDAQKKLLTLHQSTSVLDIAALDGTTALHAACINRNLRAGKVILSFYPKEERKAKKIEAVLFLIEHNLVDNTADEAGCTPLHHVSMTNNKIVAKKLLEKGAEVKAVDKLGRTALYLVAATHGCKEMIKILMTNQSASVLEIAALDGTTALHAALLNHKWDAAETIISYRPNLNLVDSKGRTAIYLAAKQTEYSILEKLLDLGADHTIPSHSGSLPLHHHCKRAYIYPHILRALMGTGNEINHKNKKGLTPLHYAIGDIFVTVWLILAGADLKVLDNNGNDINFYIRKYSDSDFNKKYCDFLTIFYSNHPKEYKDKKIFIKFLKNRLPPTPAERYFICKEYA